MTDIQKTIDGSVMTEEARNLLDDLPFEILAYSEYSLLRDTLDGLEVERDKWKARAEALQRAIADCDCIKAGFKEGE